ncbi:MAG: ABC transporter ATP-binding protein [bacterium]|nr:ABC transporter ATP-binding protein [Deltaproteobacteria bacterium]MCP4903616.1 ABC transporter ATP-binding protein [bacterium]
MNALTKQTRGPALIELEGIEKSFGSDRVLSGIDLEIRHGEIFTLLGGSGAGKSVMLKQMVGLLRPDAGRIRIGGRDVGCLPERDWIEVRKEIAYVFQGAALFDSLSVFENVAYGLREHLDLDENRIAARVAECLGAVGLEGIEARMPAELSGGMRKRVGVARAIALEPTAILYDEPTTGLDPANARRIGKLITSLRERLDVTSVVVTHDLDLCFLISDRVALLGAGHLLAVGTPTEIRASRVPEVRDFLSGDLDADGDFGSHNQGGEE